MDPLLVRTIMKECKVSFSLSSGPGGQNVNKNQTKATVRWNLSTSQLPEEIKTTLFQKLRNTLTVNQELLVHHQASRSQSMNEEAARKKLLAIVEKALKKPKRRVPTKPSKAAKRKRLDNKKKEGEKKRWRQKVEE